MTSLDQRHIILYIVGLKNLVKSIVDDFSSLGNLRKFPRLNIVITFIRILRPYLHLRESEF